MNVEKMTTSSVFQNIPLLKSVYPLLEVLGYFDPLYVTLVFNEKQP